MEKKIKEMIQSKQWKLDDAKKYMQSEIESAQKVIEGGNLAEIGRWLPVYGEHIKDYNESCRQYAMEIEELKWLLKEEVK